MGRIYAIDCSRTGRFGSLNENIKLPLSFTGTQGLSCGGYVGSQIVQYGRAQVKGNLLSVNYPGYGNDSTVFASGLVVAD